MPAEPWSITAGHPIFGEPFGVVFQDDCTFDEAEHVARSLLATFSLCGAYWPTSLVYPLHGQYLFTYRVAPDARQRLHTIWAHDIDDALLRLNILAADGSLIMPSHS